MLDRFLEFVQKGNLFKAEEKVLLAVSGGADSVMMAEMFHMAGFKFGIAHCNFHLRGEESDKDEAFVKELAETFRVKYYIKHFQTAGYSKEKDISIEMAARELRYSWFEELLEKEKYNYIGTAHHLDDEAETFFINLLRGTGISGLHGIAAKKKLGIRNEELGMEFSSKLSVIRPMLFLTKQEIVNYCKVNNVAYRDDSSNETLQYVRNKIRHKIIPELKEINPSFLKNLKETIENLKDTETINNYIINKKRAKIISERDGKIYISISKLKKLKPLKGYLFEFLTPYGFNSSVVNDILNSIEGISGKQFISPTHLLIKDREFLIISEIKESVGEEDVLINRESMEFNVKCLMFNVEYLKYERDEQISKEKNTATLDTAKLKYPLILRKWKEGDYFYPYGLNKKKKVSRFLINEKISMIEKENIRVICSGEKIIWVVGLRIDDRYKVTKNTKEIMKISVKC